MNKTREHNEKIYEKNKKEEDTLENAMLCEAIADDNLTWNPGEALYWRKKGIQIREQIYGKNDICITPYYEKIVAVLLEKGSYKEAKKWNEKSIKIKKKNNKEDSVLLLNELYNAEISWLLDEYQECNMHADRAFDILNNSTYEIAGVSRDEAYLELERMYNSYNFWARDMGKEINAKGIICGDRAIKVSVDIFDRTSLETAEAIRLKAITMRKDKKMALNLFKQSIEIYLNIKDNKRYAEQIFLDIRNTWERENVLEESAQWLYENSSKEFLLKAIENFYDNDKAKIVKELNL